MNWDSLHDNNQRAIELYLNQDLTTQEVLGCLETKMPFSVDKWQ